MARTATPTTGWLLRGQDGRLTAYAPAANGLLRWTETRPGGPEWTGPEHLVVPGLEPHLSLCRTERGYVYLFGVRTRVTDDGRTETDVVYATQFQPGRALTPWRSIGTPYGQDRDRAAQIGAPAAVVDKHGPNVFIRNAGGGVCGRRQDAKGVWGPWLDMKGSNVLDALCAAATEDGRAELLALSGETVQSWAQDEPGGPLRRVRNIPAKALSGTGSCFAAGPGRVTHFWRDAAERALHTHTHEGTEPGVPVSLGAYEDDGDGPVAAVRTTVDGHDCTVLAQRTASGLPAVAAYPTGDEAAGVFWSKTGEVCAGAPALALDAHGRVVLAAFAPDGGLCVTRQKDESGLALGRWVRV
ncbi:hypothetical protein I5Q34_30170 [Streptomyces sp. AV19]|uniref:hypothetical protein n=1 Tax=Streptomyces sp. AV19 TaxID=2793068 RepID=UPI0018FEF0D1|nr:hypothetical protein [Streptomyces sp. AV19]MBH1938475.1 hypothetical protein [Streptomyces sp. AV19]MDG4535123.1 hypothetical protein [Streptomyces sp. AV19]